MKITLLNYRKLSSAWLLILCCLLISDPISAQLLATNKFGQVRKKGKNPLLVKEALRELEKKYNITFGYEGQALDNLYVASDLWQQGNDLKTAVNALLSPLKLTYKQIKKDVFVIKLPKVSPAEGMIKDENPALSPEFSGNNPLNQLEARLKAIAFPVKGKVLDDKGESVPGVSVKLKGTSVGTVTDVNGEFSINAPDNKGVLVFSHIGFITKEVAINNKTVFEVTLETNNKELGEVVVVGYGTQEKKDVTGAVSVVKGSDIQNLPSGGAQQALQGRMSGVNVVRNGGAPGNAGSIRIRGLGTVNNADPLIVIDGVPAGSMNDVNPNDIESMDVLKDASASAIYGTRAANGVILITTKRGKFDDKLKLTVNSYYGVSNRIKTLPVLDAGMYSKLKQEAYKNDGLDVPPIWLDPQYQQQKTNWQDQIFSQGTTKNLDLSLRGGGKYSSFVISAGHYNEQGIIGKSYYERYTFRLNSDHKISDRLKIGQNLQFTNTHDNAPNTLSAQDGLLWSAIRFHPGLPVFNPDGTYSTTKDKGAFGDINNPVYTIDNQDKDNARNRILGSVSGELEVVKGLKLRANIAIDATFTNSQNFEVKITDQFRSSQWNQLTVKNDKYWAFLQEYFLSYDKVFGKHAIGLVGGYTSQTFNDIYSASQGRDFASEDPELRYLRYASTIVSLGDDNGGKSYDALQSYFMRVNYAFKDRYLLTATFRADGSSKFAPGKKWGNFPAFSLGWRISDEPFFKNLSPVVSNLKLTGGWGQLGNQNVNSLQYLALINSTYRYSFGDQNTTGSAQGRLPNPNIGWETAEMTNFGLDMGFMQNRILATVNYFIKDTRNMLLAPPAVGTLGRASIPDQNVGELRNQGLEIELTYQKKVGEFSFTLSGNATFISNKITKLLTPGSFLGGQTYGRTDQEITRSYEGSAYGTFYGWKTNGLYQSQDQINADAGIAKDPRKAQGLIHPGDVRFVDLNGDGVIDNKDRTIIGNPQPKVTYGFNTNFAYKGFDLNLFFLGVGGVDIYNADRMQGLDASYSFNMYAENAGRWQGSGSSNTIPRVSATNPNKNFRTSDLFVESGDFLRLKNVTLGYTLPKSLTERLKIATARLYVTGQNIFTITNYSGLNPELGYAEGNRSAGQYPQQNVDYAQYPQARTFTVGATISF
ncbi:TonB-linked outer membrane protein, SusC/RagA family [Pseudarcicella hirudinis]|uniref:TonB-linked outer membrane protein, SusC/RagA family n=1 Tax=Pseudarcicella hirudinis TaxID=1079859 RepID=A0A1I5TS33_9BACT|nr:TonB-dependent receptor [Pseudarcicella hirudinis]SFP85882.1 TonB-linked outer membrane protein, SusC/RagA family [Pseudarcicella hirudinis]